MDPLDRLLALRDKSERLALGLMSGMSGDGLDLALVRIRGEGRGDDTTLVAHETRPYGAALRARIRGAIHGTTRDVTTLGFDLAERWGADVQGFLARVGVAAGDVDVLGSHGQTLDHVPRSGSAPAATLQVGDGDVLAERTGILTVSDLRCRDIAAGGEGAPLVPYADWLLYARPGRTSACQNLGSIANVTVVTERLEDVEAFDTGPANALVDAFARRATGREDGIDEDGLISASGRVMDDVLGSLMHESAAFLDRAPPKSAGYSDFGPHVADRIAAAHPSVAAADLVRTAVEFSAATLADAYARWVLPRHPGLGRVLLTGGGALNPTLVARIRALLGALEVEVPEGGWVDAKEAVAFALMADATVRGRPSNVPGATGAARPALLGKLSLA